MYKSLVILVLLMASCSPSAEQIQKAIEQTKSAEPQVAAVEATDVPLATAIPQPTATIQPSNTPVPTVTIAPTETFTPTAFDPEAKRVAMEQALINAMSKHPDIETVNMVRFKDGVLEMELKTKWASRDRQPGVSFAIIQDLADVFGKYDVRDILAFAGGEQFIIHLTTYSADGDYRYQSDSDYIILNLLYNKAMSYDEWVKLAKADFR